MDVNLRSARPEPATAGSQVPTRWHSWRRPSRASLLREARLCRFLVRLQVRTMTLPDLVTCQWSAPSEVPGGPTEKPRQTPVTRPSVRPNGHPIASCSEPPWTPEPRVHRQVFFSGMPISSQSRALACRDQHAHSSSRTRGHRGHAVRSVPHRAEQPLFRWRFHPANRSESRHPRAGPDTLGTRKTFRDSSGKTISSLIVMSTLTSFALAVAGSGPS